jgi:hypothetical protein
LIKVTPEDHVDYKDLNAALKIVLDVAEYVNEQKRNNENKKHLDVLAKRLGTDNFGITVRPYRKFLRMGNFIVSLSPELVSNVF